MIINKNNKVIIRGQRNKTDGLWDVPIQLPPKIKEIHHTSNAMINLDQTKTELAEYHHATCFSPSPSTFLDAIENGNFITWPGLNSKLIRKHLPASPNTVKGHLRQEQKNLRSTRQSTHTTDEFAAAALDIPGETTHECYLTFTSKESGMSYSDLTGRYPVKSARGNQYLIVLYDYDSNAILVEPLKTRNAAEIKTGVIKLLDVLAKSGHTPKLHIMDNEASAALKQSLLKYKVNYQLVPPHVHRRNAAERAIQTFKAHFIAGLCSTDPAFPANQWDRLLPQATLTLNLLRNSRVNPKLSAHAAIYGIHDFNKCPLAPPGTRVIIHEKTDNRGTWSPHGTDAWYIGPSLEHYRCVKTFIPSTSAIRDADTVTFFPHRVPFPKTTTEDHLKQSVTDILHILNHKDAPTQLPFLHFGDETKNAITDIAELLHRSIKLPSTPILPAVPRVDESPKLLHDKQIFVLPIKTMQKPAHSTPKVPRVKNTKKPFQEPTEQLAQHASHLIHHQLNHINHPVTGKKQSYTKLLIAEPDRWNTGMANELGRLAQGVGTRMPTGTNTIFFIKKDDVPTGRTTTYANAICDYRPMKEEAWRVRLTVGGDKLDYPGDPGAPAASLTETKLVVNSVISTPGAKFMTADIKDYFLNNPMEYYEYMKIQIKWIPEEIILQYGLREVVDADGYVYVEIRKGMYGLKQAARIAYDRLVKLLGHHGYYPIRHCPGLWKHKMLATVFALCVDDFGIKYLHDNDAHHLINTLKLYYTITVDWAGSDYCGLHLQWNYKQHYVDISMPNYIDKVLKRFQHTPPAKAQHAPHDWIRPTYGQKIQYAKDIEDLPPLDSEGIQRVQSIDGTMLYYARAVDPTMLPALNEISTQQSKPTADTIKKCNQLLDYAATYPNAVIRYHASDMILHVDTDAAYLVLPKARSRIAGHYFLSNHPPPIPVMPKPRPNGPIHTECQTLKTVVSSAAEAECGGLYLNAQTAIPIRDTLIAIGHPQPATPIKTDNSTALGIVTSLMKPKRSKTWDMRYHWVEDRVHMGHIRPYWDKGENNWADYFTKHFAPAYHRIMRYKYLQKVNALTITACEGVLLPGHPGKSFHPVTSAQTPSSRYTKP